MPFQIENFFRRADFSPRSEAGKPEKNKTLSESRKTLNWRGKKRFISEQALVDHF